VSDDICEFLFEIAVSANDFHLFAVLSLLVCLSQSELFPQHAHIGLHSIFKVSTSIIFTRSRAVLDCRQACRRTMHMRNSSLIHPALRVLQAILYTLDSSALLRSDWPEIITEGLRVTDDLDVVSHSAVLAAELYSSAPRLLNENASFLSGALSILQTELNLLRRVALQQSPLLLSATIVLLEKVLVCGAEDAKQVSGKLFHVLSQWFIPCVLVCCSPVF
jgi:hypothetical protein